MLDSPHRNFLQKMKNVSLLVMLKTKGLAKMPRSGHNLPGSWHMNTRFWLAVGKIQASDWSILIKFNKKHNLAKNPRLFQKNSVSAKKFWQGAHVTSTPQKFFWKSWILGNVYGMCLKDLGSGNLAMRRATFRVAKSQEWNRILAQAWQILARWGKSG